MRLQFNLEYRTGFGEHVALNFLDENGRLDRHTIRIVVPIWTIITA